MLYIYIYTVYIILLYIQQITANQMMQYFLQHSFAQSQSTLYKFISNNDYKRKNK